MSLSPNPTGVAATATPAAAGTVTLDCAAYNYFPIQLPAGNITVKTQNLRPGATATVYFIQDATGGRTVTWGSGGTALDQTVSAPVVGDLQPAAGAAAETAIILQGSSPTLTTVKVVGKLT